MSITLRDARITMPGLPPGYVSRPRLLAQLNQAADLPLTLLCAGPGAGKTALLADWAQQAKGRVVWLTPGAADAETERFWRLLAHALPEGDDDHGDGDGRDFPVEALLDPGQELVRLLVSRVSDRQAPLIVIIDDAHVLNCPGVLDGLDTAIRGPVPGLRLILAARSDPALPLHKYRLAGQLLELRAQDLAMTAGETREVLAVHGISLTEGDFQVLLTRTEGWAAGVRLSAMRMAGAEHPGSLASQLAMDTGSTGEYLLDEVLDRLPEPHRRLLIETSFLDEVTGPLADAVTGMTGGGDMLADLARGNSFVIPLDPLQTRYRYHRLFGEVLRYLLDRRDGPSVRSLKQRAADWFEANDDLSAAVHWTVRAGHVRPAALLLARGGFAQAFVRRLDLSGLGLDALGPLLPAAPGATGSGDGETGGGTPPPHAAEAAVAALVIAAICADPESAASGLGRLRSGRPDRSRASTTLDVAADLAELLLGQQACDAEAIDSAARRLLSGTADRGGPQRLPGLQASVLLLQASAHLWHGRHDDVGILLDLALTAAQHDGLAGLELEVLAMMALTETIRSRVGRADRIAERAHALQLSTGLGAPPALELAAAGRAMIAGDFTGQAQALQRITLPGAVGADPGLSAALTLGEASLALFGGQDAEARSTLLPLAERRIPPVLAVHRDIMNAGLDTSLGRPRSALSLLDRYQGTEFAVLTASARARAHLALGDRKAARDCVRGVLTTPSAQVSRLHLVSALLYDARIALAEGDPGRALDVLSRAIEMARGEIVLPFLGAGNALADLLARHPDVADQWPAPLPSPPGAAVVPGPAVAVPAPRVSRDLTEPLTQRELTILRLLTTSMSTGEIADELCLSVNTVKTHLAAIYRKLPASRRREAVQRARELELI